MIDAGETLRTLIASKTAVSTATSGRIYHAEIPPVVSEAWKTPENVTATVYIPPIDEEKFKIDGAAPMGEGELEVWCFAGSFGAASTLAGVVNTAINRLGRTVVGSVRLHFVDLAGGPTPEVHEETGWMFMRLVFRTSMIET